MITGKFTSKHDSVVFAGELPKRLPTAHRYVGLDFGESCGLAFADLLPGQALKDVPIYLDLLDLSLGTFDSSAIRFLRLDQFLEVLQPSAIFFEDVKYVPAAGSFGPHPSPNAILARAARPIEFFGGLKYHVQAWAEARGLPARGYGIADIKRRANGKGNASKSDVTAAANKLFGTTFDPATCEETGADDMCDAAYALVLGLEDYKPTAAKLRE